MPHVASISIYPIKSFGPAQVTTSQISDGGGLEHDREFALFDANGKYVNGKRNPKVHQLAAAVDWKDATVSFKALDSIRPPVAFHLLREIDALQAWVSGYFDQSISWRQSQGGGFPDDPAAPGPTIVSDATCNEVATWYDGLPVDEIRKRFRANIEIACDQPFWEDHLFAGTEEVVRFRIGDVVFFGTNPCKRCAVPALRPIGGESYPDFAKIFMAKREETLPPWSNRSQFDHFYRLCVNTQVPQSESGKQIHVGDTVEILGTQNG